MKGLRVSGEPRQDHERFRQQPVNMARGHGKARQTATIAVAPQFEEQSEIIKETTPTFVILRFRQRKAANRDA